MPLALDQMYFAQNDPWFYSRPDVTDRSRRYVAILQQGWKETQRGEWCSRLPPLDSTNRSVQGWKIHVSANLDNAQQVLARVSKITQALGIPYKFLTSEQKLSQRLSKNFPREHSGKFITIYPEPEELGLVLSNLEDSLSEFPGPYVLSDRRWRTGPVFLRFGAFFERRGPNGEASMLDPYGRHVPDSRLPYFQIPDWCPVPEAISEWLCELVSASENRSNLPFSVSSALQFSNGTSVYSGTVPGLKNSRVVIKESRPHTGFDGLRRTAVERLRNEICVLKLLDGVEGVPSFLREFECWENSYAVTSFCDGETLQKWVSKSFPMYRPDTENANSYLEDVLTTIDRLILTVSSIHSRGFVHADIQPRNILVAEDPISSVSLVDFELAAEISSFPKIQESGIPGFRSRSQRTNVQADWYAVRQVLHFMLLPVVNLAELDEWYSSRSWRFALNWFEKMGSAKKLLQRLDSRDRDLTERMGGVMRVQRTPSRRDVFDEAFPACDAHSLRLGLVATLQYSGPTSFPTHFEGLDAKGAGLAYGFAGALLSLQLTGAKLETTSTIENLKAAVASSIKGPPTNGLFVGSLGDLLALKSAGESEFAMRQLASLYPLLSSDDSMRVWDGCAGTAIGALLMLDDSDGQCEALRSKVRSDVDRILEVYVQAPGTAFAGNSSNDEISNSPNALHSGLLFGNLGVAFLAAMAQKRWHSGIHETALRMALDLELNSMIEIEGTLQSVQASRGLPYLATGSAGFGVVLPLISEHPWIHEHRGEILKIRDATRIPFSVSAGLLNGYSGLVVGGMGMDYVLGEFESEGYYRAQLRSGVGLHSLAIEGGTAFCGDSDLRLCADLATGESGILLADYLIGSFPTFSLKDTKPTTREKGGR